jgi:hypothetical protein
VGDEHGRHLEGVVQVAESLAQLGRT